MSVIKERPILFSAPMVRAILDGTKTQTRRIVKPADLARAGADGVELWTGFMGWQPAEAVLADQSLSTNKQTRCKYGQPGDRIFVRESFWGCDLPGYGDQPCVVYDDEWAGREYSPLQARPWARRFGRIPSIHMPRDCSRILLEVVAVRIERLDDCSEADARAEGVTILDKHMSGYCAGETRPPALRAYRELWESINGAGAWAANPWVWVVEFRRVMA